MATEVVSEVGAQLSKSVLAASTTDAVDALVVYPCLFSSRRKVKSG